MSGCCPAEILFHKEGRGDVGEAEFSSLSAIAASRQDVQNTARETKARSNNIWLEIEQTTFVVSEYK